MTKHTLNQCLGSVHLLQYDLPKKDLRGELAKLADFLNVWLPAENAIECTARLQEGNFHRKKSAEEHRAMLQMVFTDDKKEQLLSACRKTEEMLTRYFNRTFHVGGDAEILLT